MSDAQTDLLARCALGDRRAFERLYRETAKPLLGVIQRIVASRSESEEVLQEVYLEIWRKASSYRADMASPMTWMRVVARGRAIDYVRHRGTGADRETGEVPLDIFADEAVGPAGHASEAQERTLLVRCLEQLPDTQRKVIFAVYVYGFSQQEVATKEAMPLGTVKSWARRALQYLRQCLRKVTG